MTGETIYDALTMIPDRLIGEAEAYIFRRKSKWRRYAALAAAFALVIGLGAGVLTGNIRVPDLGGAGSGGGGNSGGENGYSYMHYVGPVLPLTAAGDAAGVTAARHVDYDFSPYITERRAYLPGENAPGEPSYYDYYQSEAVVTDAYTLTNTTGEDRTLSLLYPVELNLNESLDRLPVVTVNGETVEATLYAAPYSGGFGDAWGGHDPTARLNLDFITDWEGYVDLLSDGSYQAAAFAPYPELTMPITVYKVDDYVVAPTEAANPSLAFTFDMDYDRTIVMTYGSNGGTNDRESGWCRRMVGGLGNTYRPPEPMYVIFYGDDIDGYTLQGYANMGGDPGTEIDVTATVTRYETTMDAFLRQVVDAWFSSDYVSTDNSIVSAAPRELLYGLAADLLASYGVFSDDPAGRYSFGMLEDVHEAYTMDRVLYLAFDVTVPAGGSAEVNASMRKDGSYDFYGKGMSVHGYDLATRLGSTLAFSEQSASISNTESIILPDNNFGFDLDAGVTEVTLDVAAEHYWMQVRHKGN